MPKPIRSVAANPVSNSVMDEIPAALKPFLFHGMDLNWKGKVQGIGACWACGRENCFYVNCETSQWDCKSCTRNGNDKTFLLQLWEMSFTATVDQDYEALRLDRKLLFDITCRKFGLAKSLISGDWLVPGWDETGKLVQLYRYISPVPGGKKVLMATPNKPHGMFCFGFPKKRAARLWIAEGIWDAMALWEVLGEIEPRSGVLGVPSCGSFKEEWSRMLTGVEVVIAFDNDHPREHPPGSGKFSCSGWDGTLRTGGVIMRNCTLKSLQCLKWGPNGYDMSKPSGTDIRDVLSSAGASKTSRASALRGLSYLVEDLPREQLEMAGTAPRLEPIVVTTWNEVVTACRKAMKWIDGLDQALSSMYATIISTVQLGDPLWMKLIGPPSCGKTTLCEAMSLATEYVFCNSVMSGFHSGWKTDRGGHEDHSLIPKIRDKTLITKDGDTLITNPNREKIMGEARDLYDGVTRVHYLHGVSRSSEDICATWILAGTESLRWLDGSELGERFIDCVIMDHVDPELEWEIQQRIAYRSMRNIGLSAKSNVQDEDADNMKRVCSGYVIHLRRNAEQILSRVTMSDEAAQLCMSYANFVAYMRCRPSKRQEETVVREFSGRLTGQFTRLALCLAGVMNKPTVDAEVMRRVRQRALDTARGRTYDLARMMRSAGESGLDTADLQSKAAETPEKTLNRLNFMRSIHVVNRYVNVPMAGLKGRLFWKLTPEINSLFDALEAM